MRTVAVLFDASLCLILILTAFAANGHPALTELEPDDHCALVRVARTQDDMISPT